MWSIIPIIATLSFLIYLAYRLNRKEPEPGPGLNPNLRTYGEATSAMHESGDRISNESLDSMEEHSDPEHVDTCALMLKVLNRIGCQPTVNDDGSVSVRYQGEYFQMEFGGRYARVWDPNWTGIKADDPDLPKVREAVNMANFNFGPTVVIAVPDEEGVIGLHSRRDIMLHPACPDNELFVRAVLDSFFTTKGNVKKCLQQLSDQQTEPSDSHRPAGVNVDNISSN
ncbi:MAG: hypothetical protein K2F87_02755 [Muribaculaceae bacterium]|nr:hypothetical protein [Muribaculaceae bacterium]